MELQDIGRGAKKLAVPAAASLAGAGAGLMLTRNSVRKALPSVGELGNLADDLKDKLDSVVGKASSTARGGERPTASRGGRLDPRELDRRLREREQRRKARRSRS
jgi:hypothetical protein